MKKSEQEVIWIKAVYENWMFLDSIDFEDQTVLICHSACRANGDAIMYCAERFIDMDLLKICIETSDRTSLNVLRRLKGRDIPITAEMSEYACSVDGRYLRNIPKDLCTIELVTVACTNTWEALHSVDETLKRKNPDLCVMCFDQSSKALKYFPSEMITFELFEDYIDSTDSELYFISNSVLEQFRNDDIERFNIIIEKSVYTNGLNLRDVKNLWQTEDIVSMAIDVNGLALQFVAPDFMTMDLMKLAVQTHGSAIKFCEDQTDELCMIAIEHGWGCFEDILHGNRTIRMAQKVLDLGGEEAESFLIGLGCSISDGVVTSV